MKENILVSSIGLKLNLRKMFVSCLANTPDSHIAFACLFAIFFVDELLSEFYQVTVICSCQSAVAGNRNDQDFFDVPFVSQIHAHVTPIAAHDIAEHFL